MFLEQSSNLGTTYDEYAKELDENSLEEVTICIFSSLYIRKLKGYIECNRL